MLTDKFGLYLFVCIEQVDFLDALLTHTLSTKTKPNTSLRFCLNSLFSLSFFCMDARNSALSRGLQPPCCRQETCSIIVQEKTLATSDFRIQKTELRKFWTVFEPDPQIARHAEYLGLGSTPAGEMCRL